MRRAIEHLSDHISITHPEEVKTSENGGTRPEKEKRKLRKKSAPTAKKEFWEKQSARTEIALLCTAIVVFKESSALTTIRKTAGDETNIQPEKAFVKRKGRKNIKK